MAETILIKRVQTEDGIGQVDYESLANLPVIDNVLKIDSANAIQNKTVTTAFNNVSTAVNNVSTKVDTVKNELVNGDTTVNNSNNLNGQPASYYAALNTQGVSTYTHSKSGTVHNFVGTGNNGKAKMTADVAAGDTFTVNGQSVSAYCGPESATDAMAGETYSGKWVTFVFDGAQLNFKGGGGLSNTKLAQATATVNDVLSPKTFFSGNATLKQGTIQSMGGSDFILDANNTSHTFTTSGKYCTGNMTVSTSTKSAESKTITPSGSAQSYTFATSGKLCTGNMTVSVPATIIHNTSWTIRSVTIGSTLSLETHTIGAPDGNGVYAWTASCGTWYGNDNSPVEFHFMGANYGVQYGNGKSFWYSGINTFDSSTTFTARQYGGFFVFYYVRLY